MDTLKVAKGNYKLEEATKLIKEAEQLLRDGLDAHDPLKYAIAATERGWPGLEMQVVSDITVGLEKLTDTLATVKSQNAVAWKQNIERDVWPFVEPIADQIDVATMLKYYTETHREAIVRPEDGETDVALHSYIVEALCNPQESGINTTLDEITGMCNVEGYIDYTYEVDSKTELEDDANSEEWVYHMLTHFFDCILSMDGFDSSDYCAKGVSEETYDAKRKDTQ